MIGQPGQRYAEGLAERAALEAEARASNHLANGNAASERGNHRAAERHYTKAQFWLDRANKLRRWN
jgi:hypothetical protein